MIATDQLSSQNTIVPLRIDMANTREGLTGDAKAKQEIDQGGKGKDGKDVKVDVEPIADP